MKEALSYYYYDPGDKGRQRTSVTLPHHASVLGPVCIDLEQKAGL